MPPVGALIASTVGSALFSAGASVAVVNTAIAVTSALTSVGLSVGLSFAASLLNRPKQQKPSDGQQETKQSVPDRVYHYGRVKVSGPYAFYESRGSKAYRAILISCRPIDAFEGFYLDDVLVTLDVNGGVTDKPTSDDDGKPNVVISAHLGSDDQAADAILTADFPEWTAEHRLRGTSYIVVSAHSPDAEVFSARYPNGLPEVSTLLRGVRLYDPRKDGTVPGGAGTHRLDAPATWEWSENAALAVLDYLLHADGYALGAGRVDLQSFRAFAEICGQPVPTFDGDPVGRYSIATTVRLTEARKVVLQRLLEACDATLTPLPDGRVGIRGGVYDAPTVTIDDDSGHIIEASFSPPDALDRYNELAIKYLEPALGYIENEGKAWTDEADYAASGKRITQSADYYQVPSHSQARRLAKIQMVRDNPEWRVELLTNLAGLSCIGERGVRLVWPELGIDAPFWIDGGVELSEDITTVRMQLRSADPSAYNWTLAEEGEPAVVPENTTPSFDLAAPKPALFEIAGPAIGAYWRDEPPKAGYDAQLRPIAVTAYEAMTVAPDRKSATSSVVAATGSFAVRMRANAGPQAKGQWSPDLVATIGAVNAIPDPLTLQGWSLSALTRAAAAVDVPAPNGGPAFLFSETIANAEHTASQVATLTLTNSVYASIYVKAKDLTQGRLRLFPTAASAQFIQVAFDFVAKTATVTKSAGATATVGLIEDAIILRKKAPDGTTETTEWYRIGVGGVLGGADNSVTMRLSTGLVPHAGETAKGFYLWGAKIEAGAAPTTLKVS